MKMFRYLLCASALLLISCAAEPQLSKHAPQDKPSSVAAYQFQAFEEALKPHIAQAKATYPAAKAKYLRGLPSGQIFFVTTRIFDGTGAFEQSFIRVDSIQNGSINGRIWNEINRIQGYKNGDPYTLDEADVMDWTIAHPDGTEEGNVVGKFLDTYQPSGT